MKLERMEYKCPLEENIARILCKIWCMNLASGKVKYYYKYTDLDILSYSLVGKLKGIGESLTSYTFSFACDTCLWKTAESSQLW